MKILIFSDSHGTTEPMCRSIDREVPDVVIHLGDYVQDAEFLRLNYPSLTLYNVRGNCDIGSGVSEKLDLMLDSVPVFLCHGHRYNVKMGTEKLLNAGWFSGAKLILFGHTHIPFMQEFEELTILNPGSASSSAAKVITDGNGHFSAELFRP